MTKAEIEAFLMVAKEGNMTAAAAKMYISQSSLSLRIKTLEKEVGCELLIRSRGGHGIRLTPKGERFLELAIQYKEITEKMLAIGHGQEKQLRIGAVNSISSYLLPDVCEQFMKVYPDAGLEVHDFEKTTEICRWLEHGQLDMALAGGSTTKSKVSTVPLFREKMVLICGKEVAANDVIKLKELDPAKEIYSNWFTDYIQWHDKKFLKGRTPAIFVSNMTQLNKFLAQGGRWALVPASVAHGLMGINPRLMTCRTDFEMPPRLTNLLLPARSQLQPYHEDFLDSLHRYVTETYGEDIEWY